MDAALERNLLFVTGKGGVGKTTVSAALAVAAARRGKRVLLCDLAATSAFAQVFGVDDVGFDATEVDANVWATLCDPQESLVTFLTRFVKMKRVAKALVANRVARRFFEAAPGVLETVVLQRIAWILRHPDRVGPDFDLIIVDLPSTGHAVSYLDVPRRMAQLVRIGPLAELLESLAGLLADRERVELLIVSNPEEMPIRETIELWNIAGERLEVAAHTIVVNRIRQTDLTSDVVHQLTELPTELVESSPALRAAKLVAGWEVEARALIDELEAEVDAEVVEVPWVARYENERELVGRIASHLFPDDASSAYQVPE